MSKMKDQAIDNANKDFHPECSHCTITKAPMWPIEDLEAWKMDVCMAEAFTEDAERNVTQAKKDKIVSAEKAALKAKDLEKKRRDQKSIHMSTMREAKERRLGLLQINYGGNTNMAKKNTTETAPVKEKTLSKTGYLDQLISADLQGSYAEGAKDTIVASVIERFPDLDSKRVSGLFFSRRAVLKAQAAKAETAAA